MFWIEGAGRVIHRACRVAIATVLIVGVSGVMAQDAPESETAFERLERQLELRAHTALQDRIRDGQAELAPFETDGCSGGMSYVWSMVAGASKRFVEAHNEHPPWENCCVEHDRAYHAGGTEDDPEQGYAARLQADETLRSCVLSRAGTRTDDLSEQYGLSEDDVQTAYEAIAAGMFMSVRLGGKPCTGLPWRWGYGYPDCGFLSD